MQVGTHLVHATIINVKPRCNAAKCSLPRRCGDHSACSFEWTKEDKSANESSNQTPAVFATNIQMSRNKQVILHSPLSRLTAPASVMSSGYSPNILPPFTDPPDVTSSEIVQIECTNERQLFQRL